MTQEGERSPLLLPDPVGAINEGECDSQEEAEDGADSAATGSSWYASVFIVVNAALGAGLLNFPAAFDKSGGLGVAITVQAVLMIFIIGALLILAYCSDFHQSATYQDVVYSMCGKKAQTACSLCITVYSFGCCVTFFIITGDQWDKFFTFLYGAKFCEHWYLNRKFTITISAIVLVLPLCYPRRIDFLKYASMAGVVAVLYCVILVTVKYFVGPINPGPIKHSPQDWTDVFIVVPDICFAYQCHISCVPVYACLKKRTHSEFLKTVFVALAVCVFAYTGTASFGYLTFGSKVDEDILSSYDPTPDVLVAVVLIAAKMYTTYPILLFVGRAALESMWRDARKLTAEQVALGEKRRRYGSTTVWFCLSLLLAVFVPNIGAVISALGGLAALFIFIFPGMCLLQVLLQGHVHPIQFKLKYRLLFAVACMYIVIGAFLFGVTSSQSIWNDLTQVSMTPAVCGSSLGKYLMT